MSSNSRPNKQIIKREFKKFLDKEIPSSVHALGEDHGKCFVEVFTYVREPKKLIGVSGDDLKTYFYYPVGRVLEVGEHFGAGSETFHSRLRVGDIVRLSDHSFTTYANPDYASWTQNEMSNSNVKDRQVGVAPPKFVSMIAHLSRQMFTFDVFGGDGDANIYHLEVPQIIARVEDWEKLF